MLTTAQLENLDAVCEGEKTLVASHLEANAEITRLQQAD
jgi:hypothetical protein